MEYYFWISLWKINKQTILLNCNEWIKIELAQHKTVSFGLFGYIDFRFNYFLCCAFKPQLLFSKFEMREFLENFIQHIFFLNLLFKNKIASLPIVCLSNRTKTPFLCKVSFRFWFSSVNFRLVSLNCRCHSSILCGTFWTFSAYKWTFGLFHMGRFFYFVCLMRQVILMMIFIYWCCAMKTFSLPIR